MLLRGKHDGYSVTETNLEGGRHATGCPTFEPLRLDVNLGLDPAIAWRAPSSRRSDDGEERLSVARELGLADPVNPAHGGE